MAIGVVLNTPSNAIIDATAHHAKQSSASCMSDHPQPIESFCVCEGDFKNAVDKDSRPRMANLLLHPTCVSMTCDRPGISRDRFVEVHIRSALHKVDPSL